MRSKIWRSSKAATQATANDAGFEASLAPTLGMVVVVGAAYLSITQSRSRIGNIPQRSLYVGVGSSIGAISHVIYRRHTLDISKHIDPVGIVRDTAEKASSPTY